MIGPIMVGISGLKLNDDEISILASPIIGGVIIFARNFKTVHQLKTLIKSIRIFESETRNLLIAIDHEGGLVQRIIDDVVTTLPSAHSIGSIYDSNKDSALEIAYLTGLVTAYELLDLGFDFSFSPVVDIDNGSSIISRKKRSYHSNPDIISIIALRYIAGMKQIGMTPVLKHFPGHGSVQVDSHFGLPNDHRSLDEIEQKDMKPFIEIIQNQNVAIMPAHILFEKIDQYPTSLSSIWITDLLRNKYQFTGPVISDGFEMQALRKFESNLVERAIRAIDAGVDMLCICHPHEDDYKELLALLEHETFETSTSQVDFKEISQRLETMKPKSKWRTKATQYHSGSLRLYKLMHEYRITGLNRMSLEEMNCIMGKTHRKNKVLEEENAHNAVENTLQAQGKHWIEKIPLSDNKITIIATVIAVAAWSIGLVKVVRPKAPIGWGVAGRVLAILAQLFAQTQHTRFVLGERRKFLVECRKPQSEGFNQQWWDCKNISAEVTAGVLWIGLEAVAWWLVLDKGKDSDPSDKTKVFIGVFTAVIAFVNTIIIPQGIYFYQKHHNQKNLFALQNHIAGRTPQSENREAGAIEPLPPLPAQGVGLT